MTSIGLFFFTLLPSIQADRPFSQVIWNSTSPCRFSLALVIWYFRVCRVFCSFLVYSYDCFLSAVLVLTMPGNSFQLGYSVSMMLQVALRFASLPLTTLYTSFLLIFLSLVLIMSFAYSELFVLLSATFRLFSSLRYPLFSCGSAASSSCDTFLVLPGLGFLLITFFFTFRLFALKCTFSLPGLFFPASLAWSSTHTLSIISYLSRQSLLWQSRRMLALVTHSSRSASRYLSRQQVRPFCCFWSEMYSMWRRARGCLGLDIIFASTLYYGPILFTNPSHPHYNRSRPALIISNPRAVGCVAMDKTRTIVTKDGGKYEVSEALLIRYSEFLRDLLSQQGNQSQEIVLPSIESSVFDLVLQFMQIHEKEPVVKFDLPLKPNTVLHQMMTPRDVQLIGKFESSSEPHKLKILEGASYLQVEELQKILIASLVLKSINETVSELNQQHVEAEADFSEQVLRRIKFIQDIKESRQ